MDEMTIDDYLAMEQEQMMEEPDWEEEAALQGQTELPPPPQTKAALVSPVKETTAPMPKIHQSNQSQPSIR